MRIRSLALLAVCTLPLAACATAKERYREDGYRFLTGSEVRELVSGNTVEGRYINRSGTWADYHAPEGIVSSFDNGSGYLGTWEIRDDEICYDYSDEPIPNCLEVAEKDGSYVHFLANGPYRGNLGGEWTGVTPGNVKNLPLE
jgi:hypothetical protein